MPYKLLFIFAILFLFTNGHASLTQSNASHPLGNLHLHKLETERFSRIKSEYEKRNIHVDVFYHTSATQEFWKEVIMEQLDLLDGWQHVLKQNAPTIQFERSRKRSHGNIMALASNLHVFLHDNPQKVAEIKSAILAADISYKDRILFSEQNTVGRFAYMEVKEEDKPKFMARAVQENRSAGEYATIMSLRDHCQREVKAGRNSVVLYFHNKGARYPKGGGSVADWRDLMNTFNLEFPSMCLRALLSGHSACGVDYQIAQYAGNFWWASCNHVAMLPPLPGPVQSAWDCEYFLFHVGGDNHDFGSKCAYKPFHCKVDHYHLLCPRDKYSHVLHEILSSDDLPPIHSIGDDMPFREVRPLKWKDKPCLSANTPVPLSSDSRPYNDVW